MQGARAYVNHLFYREIENACHIIRAEENTLDFTVRRTRFKIFQTTSQSFILDCQIYSNFPVIIACLQQRKCKFAASENMLCNYVHLL